MYQVGAFDQPAMKQANGPVSRPFGQRPIARKVALFLTMLSTLAAAGFGLERPVHARATASIPTGCSQQGVVARAVTRLTGPSSMRLDDGSEIKLAGVLLPTALDTAGNPEKMAPCRHCTRETCCTYRGQCRGDLSAVTPARSLRPATGPRVYPSAGPTALVAGPAGRIGPSPRQPGAVVRSLRHCPFGPRSRGTKRQPGVMEQFGLRRP